MKRITTWAFTHDERALARQADVIATRVGLFALVSNGTWKDLLGGAAVGEEHLTLLAQELRRVADIVDKTMEHGTSELRNLRLAEIDVCMALALLIDPMAEVRKGDDG